MTNRRLAVLATLLASATAPSVAGASILHVHDSVGRLGTVDSDTGAVDVIGPLGVTLFDIAFDADGDLFGLTSSTFYRVDPQTAATTAIGSHGVPGGNALVFGTDGILYAAGGSSNDLFTIDPTTGVGTSIGTTGFASGGDLAFVGGNLFLADQSGQLVSIDLDDLPASDAIGPFGIESVFGIATDETDTLFGVGGTTIFEVDTATGSATNALDFGGNGLSGAFGQSFVTEAATPDPVVPPAPEPAPVVPPIPLPASGLLLMGALAACGAAFRRTG